MLGKYSYETDFNLVSSHPTICVSGVIYVAMKYKSLKCIVCPQGTNNFVEKKTYKCEKNSKIGLIPISDKLNDTESKLP